MYDDDNDDYDENCKQKSIFRPVSSSQARFRSVLKLPPVKSMTEECIQAIRQTTLLAWDINREGRQQMAQIPLFRLILLAIYLFEQGSFVPTE